MDVVVSISLDTEDLDDAQMEDNRVIDILLSEYEQARIDRRRSINRQAQLIFSGIAAIAAIIGYSVLVDGTDPVLSDRLAAVASVLVVIGLGAVFAIEEEKNRRIIESNMRRIENEVSKISIHDSRFGIMNNFRKQEQLNYPIHLWISGIVIPSITLATTFLRDLLQFEINELWIAAIILAVLLTIISILLAIYNLPGNIRPTR